MHEVEPRYIPAMPSCNCTTVTCDMDHRFDSIEPVGPNRKQRRAMRKIYNQHEKRNRKTLTDRR